MPKINTATIYAARNAFRDAFGKFVDPKNIAELDALGVDRENIFVDLERRMKCGVGKCGHCQINDKYCCIDGPVFTYAEIHELEEAI